MNVQLSDATSGQDGLIESTSRYPGACICTLADLMNDVHSDSPLMREHAMRMAYALGGLHGPRKVNKVLTEET